MAVAAVGLSACEKEAVADYSDAATTADVVIYASTGATTKIDFTDNDAEGISLEWEANDKFYLYDSEGACVGYLTCKDTSTGRFEGTGFSLTEDAEYTALYCPDAVQGTNTLTDTRESIDLSSQFFHSISILDELCHMEGTFTYSSSTGVVLAFEHKKAILTVKFEYLIGATPTELTIQNGDDTYECTLDDIQDDSGVYTVYAWVEPCDDTPRTLSFTISYDNMNEETYTYETSKAYVAGYRYTADLTATDDAGDTTELTLAEVSSADIATYSDTWVITDEAWNSNSTASSEYSAFSALRSAANAAVTAGRNITVEFPNMTAFPGNGFYSVVASDDDAGSVSVLLPEVTEIGNSSFQASTAVVSISAPKLETIGYYAFNSCSNLASFEIASSVTSIIINPFY